MRPRRVRYLTVTVVTEEDLRSRLCVQGIVVMTGSDWTSRPAQLPDEPLTLDAPAVKTTLETVVMVGMDVGRADNEVPKSC